MSRLEKLKAAIYVLQAKSAEAYDDGVRKNVFNMAIARLSYLVIEEQNSNVLPMTRKKACSNKTVTMAIVVATVKAA